MITFGLTGGIACGKSTVTKTFRSFGIPIVDADIVARQVVELGTTGLDMVIGAFGKEYLQSDGTLNRTKLGTLVFADKDAMHKLDILMQPIITEEADSQLQKLHDAGHLIVGYDAALICEMGNVEKFRPLIVVHCPQVTQVERLMSRNNLTHAEAMLRIAAQMPVEKKLALSDYAVDTSGTILQSQQQTENILFRLKARNYRDMLHGAKIRWSEVPFLFRDFIDSGML
jgi:dephospho-CoA kinase